MPPTTVADLVLVRTQVIEKVFGNIIINRYTDALDGSNSEWPSKQEITDNCILADEIICQDLISTPGNGWRQQFLQWTADLDSGSAVTQTTGAYGEVKVKVGGTYKFSQPSKSREEILRMIQFPNLYTDKFWHFVQDGIVLTPGDKVQVQYPVFTRGVTLQGPQTAEPAIIWGAISLSEKMDSGGPFFQKYDRLFGVGREYVKTGQIIPPMEQLEQMIASGQAARAA